jgi:4'-phosphopantetheinyl transferase
MQTDSTEPVQLIENEFHEYLAGLSVPPLEACNVHSWFARISNNPVQLAEYRSHLSADELARAQRFHFESDRAMFIFAHGMLRTLLGIYLRSVPRKLQFEYSEHGKPSLAVPSNTGIQFNLSHTRGAVLVAICRDRHIGADIEEVRADFDLEEIAAKFFTVAEQASLLRLHQKDRAETFFRYWTRKEAVLKARGDGLSFPLDRLDVSQAENSAVLTSSPSRPQYWPILPLKVPAEFAAAIALQPCL